MSPVAPLGVLWLFFGRPLGVLWESSGDLEGFAHSPTQEDVILRSGLGVFCIVSEFGAFVCAQRAILVDIFAFRNSVFLMFWLTDMPHVR